MHIVPFDRNTSNWRKGSVANLLDPLLSSGWRKGFSAVWPEVKGGSGPLNSPFLPGADCQAMRGVRESLSEQRAAAREARGQN